MLRTDIKIKFLLVGVTRVLKGNLLGRGKTCMGLRNFGLRSSEAQEQGF